MISRDDDDHVIYVARKKCLLTLFGDINYCHNSTIFMRIMDVVVVEFSSLTREGPGGHGPHPGKIGWWGTEDQ